MEHNTAWVPEPINTMSASHIRWGKKKKKNIHYFNVFPAVVPLTFNLIRRKKLLLSQTEQIIYIMVWITLCSDYKKQNGVSVSTTFLLLNMSSSGSVRIHILTLKFCFIILTLTGGEAVRSWNSLFWSFSLDRIVTARQCE